jgi:hypothetical protein
VANRRLFEVIYNKRIYRKNLCLSDKLSLAKVKLIKTNDLPANRVIRVTE